jgi:hypothetical protein
MSESCIFCDNNSGSREHLWPKWIHERKDFGALRLQRGKSTEKIVPNPELKVKTVCGTCNTGWMSGLEAENIPIIGSTMQDISTPLDGAQQKSIAAWSVKTAMMSDSMKGRNAPNRFYDGPRFLAFQNSGLSNAPIHARSTMQTKPFLPSTALS